LVASVSERGKRDEKKVGALSAFGKKRALDIMTPKKYPLGIHYCGKFRPSPTSR